MVLPPSLVTLATLGSIVRQESVLKPVPCELINPGVEYEDLGLVQVLPVRRHLVPEVEAIPVLVGTVLGELATVHPAVLGLHQEPAHLVVRSRPEVTVDSVVGDVGSPGLDHPEVLQVHLPTLPSI